MGLSTNKQTTCYFHDHKILTKGSENLVWKLDQMYVIHLLLDLHEVKNRGVFSGINGSIVAVLIADGLCQASRLADASRVLDELRVRDCKPDFMAYRIVAEAFRVQGQLVETEKVLKRKRKFGVSPRANDYREFILNLISEKRIQEAKELGEVITGGNFPIEEDVLNVLIGSVSAIDPDSAVSFFKFMSEKDWFPALLTLSNLSRNLCKNGKTEELVDVYRKLSSMGYFLDMERYNVMVSFLCMAGRVKEAYGALQEMRKKGFIPDVFSYNSVMEACCREELLRPAKRLWDEMFANGCPGNLKTYNILIGKLSETGEVEEACHLFYHMLERGVTPDSYTYTSILEGLCREAKVGAACEIVEMSIRQDIKLAQFVLTTLIRSLCKQGNFGAAAKVLCGLPPDLKDYDCHVVLLKGLADAGEMDMALEHIQWLVKSSPCVLLPVSAELVASLSSALKPEPVVQLIHAMMEKSFIPYNPAWMGLCDGLSIKRC
ncbi:Pentatricopeptide repeat-containing protein [Thalictrum thalictroides]|uniref:Pentatricopeptide repeat-containing protein n=1 Tax=Thalictrum thalictroides TaxID=46969 RepID=A0A7J6WHT5_THATH|nr:Pentatricopeptide repeat-containing protein [Thalictrum thalictroides]